MECLLVRGEVGEDVLEQLLRELDVHTENMNYTFSLCFKQDDVGYIIYTSRAWWVDNKAMVWTKKRTVLLSIRALADVVKISCANRVDVIFSSPRLEMSSTELNGNMLHRPEVYHYCFPSLRLSKYSTPSISEAISSLPTDLHHK